MGPAHDVSAMSIHHILIHEKWHSFKIKITYELIEDSKNSVLRRNGVSIWWW